ncbi:MAG TPA: helix-turn-helix domain-containing protein [Thermoanaerobaculia bacterium]|nr:helix-turn-helix domain-containing protein [Thermoanaerobaculia bacterium]
MNTTTAPLTIIDRPDAAAALVDPIRQRILATLDPPDSAAGVARRIGLGRQKVNYHLRELEKVGLVEVAEERRKGNCVEKVMRPVARRFVISAEALGEVGLEDPKRAQERFSWAHLVGVAARAIRDLGLLSRRAQESAKALPTLCWETEVQLAKRRDLEAFAADLTAAIGEVVARHHDEKTKGGRRFRLFVGGHPAIDASGAGGAQPPRNQPAEKESS